MLRENEEFEEDDFGNEVVPMASKPWWASKTIWSDLATALLGIYYAMDTAYNLPDIPPWVLIILAAVGINGRVKARTKITG